MNHFIDTAIKPGKKGRALCGKKVRVTTEKPYSRTCPECVDSLIANHNALVDRVISLKAVGSEYIALLTGMIALLKSLGDQ